MSATHKAAREIFNLDVELHKLGGVAFDSSWSEYESGIARDASYFLEDVACQKFDLSKELLSKPLEHIAPSHPLAARTIQWSNTPNLIPASGLSAIKYACLGAEAWLFRSLHYLETTAPEDINSKHEPAAVLFDTEGAPFAFRKSSGLFNAYAWRSASFPTQDKAMLIPGDSWFMVGYGADFDPLDTHLGAGLLALAAAEPPEAASFLRFSTRCFSHETLRTILPLAILADDRAKLETTLPEAYHMQPAAVAQRVHSLLRAGRATQL